MNGDRKAGAVWVGTRFLGWETREFALASLVLAAIWIVLAWKVARAYRTMVTEKAVMTAPELRGPISDFYYTPGERSHHELATNAFVDADPGDILTLAAFVDGGQPLPSWLEFNADRLRFRAHPPDGYENTHQVEVVATDIDGLTAQGTFRLHPRHKK